MVVGEGSSRGKSGGREVGLCARKLQLLSDAARHACYPTSPNNLPYALIPPPPPFFLRRHPPGTGADGEDWGDDEGLDENEDLFDEQDLRYLEKLEKNATMYHAYFNDVEVFGCRCAFSLKKGGDKIWTCKVSVASNARRLFYPRVGMHASHTHTHTLTHTHTTPNTTHIPNAEQRRGGGRQLLHAA